MPRPTEYERLIPEQHRHPLREILSAAWQHFELTRRKTMVEYVLLRGINDSLEEARRLAGLLSGHVVTVNLLAWNPARPDAAADCGRDETSQAFAPSPRPAVTAFREALRAAGVEVTIRASRGTDIQAACGQLAAQQLSYND